MTLEKLRGRLLISLVLGALVFIGLSAYADFSEVIDGHEEQVFHGHVVRPGTMLSVRIVHRFPADRAWAQHVLNSVRYVG